MAELLAIHNLYNDPANPNGIAGEPLTEADRYLYTGAEDPMDPANHDRMQTLVQATEGVARAKHELESSGGLRAGHRSEALRTALRTQGEAIDAANPNANQEDRLKAFLAGISSADRIQAERHGEVPHRANKLLSAIGGSAVMQHLARHRKAYTLALRTTEGVLTALSAAAALATGGASALATEGAKVLVRGARGAVVGAAVGGLGARAARARENTSEAIRLRNAKQESALNDFALRQIKLLTGHTEDADVSTTELFARVNTMAGDRYGDLRTRLINHVVDTSRGVNRENAQRSRQAILHGAGRGFGAGLLAGGAAQFIPNIEHLTSGGGHEAVNAVANTPGTPNTEQVNQAMQEMQQHSDWIDKANAEFPDKGTQWATLQDHGHLSDAATQKGILDTYAELNNNGFKVDAHGLTLNSDGSYAPNSGPWWGDVQAQEGGHWLAIDDTHGHVTDYEYIPAGEVNNSGVAALADALQNGHSHFETADQVRQHIADTLKVPDPTSAPEHLAQAAPGLEQTALETATPIPPSWSLVEDVAAAGGLTALDAARSVNRAQDRVEKSVAQNEVDFTNERRNIIALVDGITAANGRVDERLNAFADAMFAHDSPVATFLVHARSRGLAAETQAMQDLFDSLELGAVASTTPLTINTLRGYLDETFEYRRGLEQFRIDLAGGNADSALPPIDFNDARNNTEVSRRVNELINRIARPAAGTWEASVSSAIDNDRTIDQRQLLNALGIDNLQLANLREVIARHDAAELARQVPSIFGGTLSPTTDLGESADRISRLYEGMRRRNPRPQLLSEVGSRIPDLLENTVRELHIDTPDASGNLLVRSDNLPQILGYRRELDPLSADLEAASPGGVLRDVNYNRGTNPQAQDRLRLFMTMTIPGSVSSALSSDDTIRQELLTRTVLRINNLDVPTLRQEIASRDIDIQLTQFRGGVAPTNDVDAASDPAERESRLADFYDVFRNNPRRQMILNMSAAGTPTLLTPVVNALHVTDLPGGGLSDIEALHRELSVREANSEFAVGSARRPADWDTNLDRGNGNFGSLATQRLQELIENVSAGQRIGLSRWQSGESVLDLVGIDVPNMSDPGVRAALWSDLQTAYTNAAGGTAITVNSWEDAINNLPRR